MDAVIRSEFKAHLDEFPCQGSVGCLTIFPLNYVRSDVRGIFGNAEQQTRFGRVQPREPDEVETWIV